MTTRRLYAPELPGPGASVTLPSESLEHARVLRLAPGDALTLIDTRLGVADALVMLASPKRIVCEVRALRRLPAPSPELHLVLALPKGKKLEDMVRMLTELGVTALHLARSERSVARFEGGAGRLERLARIAREACVQSGQPLAPTVHEPVTLLDAARRAPADADKLLFWEEGGIPLPQGTRPAPACAFAVIGPEGGLSPAETAALRELGYTTYGLGSAVLRVQTAAPVIAALLLDRLGRLRGAAP